MLSVEHHLDTLDFGRCNTGIVKREIWQHNGTVSLGRESGRKRLSVTSGAQFVALRLVKSSFLFERAVVTAVTLSLLNLPIVTAATSW